jgi:glutathione synthase/RimK-type ligase-like ATP-grasp enzyme
VGKEELLKIRDLNYAPCIFQEMASRSSELRITVVGDKIFGAKLLGKSILDGHNNYQYSPSKDHSIRVCNMPDSFNECCLELIKSLGLKYAAIDFMIDKDERILFLEVNPTGDWYWIERRTKLPITKAMVDFLADYALSS